MLLSGVDLVSLSGLGLVLLSEVGLVLSSEGGSVLSCEGCLVLSSEVGLVLLSFCGAPAVNPETLLITLSLQQSIKLNSCQVGKQFCTERCR